MQPAPSPAIDAWHWAPEALARIESDPDARLPPVPAAVAGEAWVEAVSTLGQVRRRIAAGEHAAARADLRVARQQLKRAAARAPVVVRALQAWAQLDAAHLAYGEARFAAALRDYGVAARAFGAGRDARGLGVAWRGLGNVCKFAGLYAEAADYYRRAAAQAEATGDRAAGFAVEHNLGNVHAALGEHDLAEAAYRRALAGTRRLGRVDLVHAMSVSYATVAVRRGRPAEALRRLVRGLRALGAAEPHAGHHAEWLAVASAAHRAQGRHAEATAHAAAALALAERAGDAHTEALARHERAAGELALGRTTEAAAELARALACERRFGLPTEFMVELHELGAEVAKARADWRGAVTQLEAARTARQRLERRAHELRARHLALRAALDPADDVASVTVSARGAGRAAGRPASSLERVPARTPATGAAPGTPPRSAPVQGAATRRRAGDEPVSSPPPRPGERLSIELLRPLGLTARESEVLLWLVRGKSNAAIAQLLGCGAETVKSHVQRLYEKLGVSGRLAVTAHVIDYAARSAAD